MSHRQIRPELSKDLRPISLKEKNCSGATFYLFDEGKETFLRKVALKNGKKLKVQFDWLAKNKNLPFVFEVFNPVEEGDSFSYDMPYISNARSAEYLSSESDEKVLKAILESTELLYAKNSKVEKRDAARYLDLKLKSKLEDCLVLDKNLESFFNKEVLINEQEYKPISQLIEALYGELDLISEGHNYEIHGDLTLENILITPEGSNYLIDPNGENIISTMEVELGKVFQSLHSHYEKLTLGELRIENLQQMGPSDSFVFLTNYIEKKYGEKFLRKVYFHELIHLARLLPYKQKYQGEAFESFLQLFIMRSNQYLGNFK